MLIHLEILKNVRKYKMTKLAEKNLQTDYNNKQKKLEQFQSIVSWNAMDTNSVLVEFFKKFKEVPWYIN